MLKQLILTAVLTASVASAQAPAPPAAPVSPAPAACAALGKVEIQEVEVTAPASSGTTPTVASDDVGEVLIPLLARNADGKPAAGVVTTWEIKNTGKKPVYVLQASSGDYVKQIAATIAAGETYKLSVMTGMNGAASVLFNATATTAASIKVVTSGGEVKNMRDSAQSIDWIGF